MGGIRVSRSPRRFFHLFSISSFMLFPFAISALATPIQNDAHVTTTVRAQYASVQQLEPILSQLLSSEGKLIIDERSNSLVVHDLQSNAEAICNTVSELDVEKPFAIYTLKYADPAAIAEKVLHILGPSGGTVEPDSRTHSLYVMATRANLDIISSLLSTWDKRAQQVFIEADILDVSSAKLQELGIEWELRIGYDGGNHDAVINVNAPRSSTDVSPSGAISAGTPSQIIPSVYDIYGNLITPGEVIPGSDFSATIQALIEDSSTKTLSRPRIMVLDGQPARFEVATLEPYANTHYTEFGTAASLDIEFLDIGIILETVPHINDDGYILMEIQPEISKLVDEQLFETTIIPDEGGVITNRIRVPVKAQSRATTFVMVRDNQTIVIGGLRTREDLESVRKVPLLADIPILGIPFRNLNQAHQKRELIIFITPHITTGDVPGEQLSDYLTDSSAPKESE